MNRKDFLKLFGAFLLGACAPKTKYQRPGDNIMLPSTNRFGDQLRSMFELVRDPNNPGRSIYPLNQLDDVQRIFNELDQRDGVYRSWLQPQSYKIASSAIEFPFDLVAHTNFNIATASITIDHIPTRFSHLFVIGGGRSDVAAANDIVSMQFNGDTGANYDTAYDGHLNGADSLDQTLATTYCRLGTIAGGSAAAGASGSFFAFLPHIRSSLWKGALCLTGARLTNTFNIAGAFHYSTWKNTNPITSIKIFLASGNFDVNSEISVLGIK